MLDELERGLGCARAMVLVPMIETAAAVTAMAAIAAASPRIVGLLMGAGDLAAECGCAADDKLIVMTLGGAVHDVAAHARMVRQPPSQRMAALVADRRRARLD